MDDNELYDEFGNYIGPDLDAEGDSVDGGDEQRDEDDELERAFQNAQQQRETSPSAMQEGEDDAEGATSTAIVLHEDKKYYPSAEEVYGEGVETMVQEEDAQPLEQPIVQPVKTKHFTNAEAVAPTVTYDKKFLQGLMKTPDLIRNIAVVGHLHHGKTSMMDCFVRQTHVFAANHEFEKYWSAARQPRYLDGRLDEQKRGLSIKSNAMSFVMQDTRGKSHLLNFVDAPGHTVFADEQVAAMQSCDGVVVAVDCVEGLLLVTKRVIRHAIEEKLPIVLLLTKIDRLMVELKLPPDDAYFKMKHVIHQVNSYIQGLPIATNFRPVFSPELGNVIFSSPMFDLSFTLQSFALQYKQKAGAGAAKMDSDKFSRKLWGDYWMDPRTRTFKSRMPGDGVPRSFVQFILEPIYKIISQVLGESAEDIAHMLARLNIQLSKTELQNDAKPLLRTSLGALFRSHAGFVDAVVSFLPSPVAAARSRCERLYTGADGDGVLQHIASGSSDGPLMAQVIKLIDTADCSRFDALAYIHCGSVKTGQRVRVLGESFSLDDDEECTEVTVSGVCASGARYRVEVGEAGPGNLVLLQGVDVPILKTATLTSSSGAEEASIFRSLRHIGRSVMRVSIEPLNPAELPKMLDGLRKASKSYPLLTTKVEESGEHILLGTGELFLDCVLHDLRMMYSEIEVKVADPVVSFCETVVETSSLKCFAETPNKKNKFTMIAEPLDKGLAEDIENHSVSVTWDRRSLGNYLQRNYNWDALAARSVWAFGPDLDGPNVLLDDTLPSEVDKKLLASVRDHVVQGFQWGAREGPLCDEPIRNVKFKLLDAVVDEDPIARGGGQVIPTVRRVGYSAFLMATPRLMEPVSLVEILCPTDCITALYNVISRRRGQVVKESAQAGTPMYVVEALIPVIESFGFETDLRTHTQGQAFGLQTFDHWAVVPGDPMDKSIVLKPLEIQPPLALAREFVIKTRRRKGLAEDISVAKFFDDPMLRELAAQDVQLADLF